MATTVHIYSSPSQPATRFRVEVGDRTFTVQCRRRSTVWCRCCKRLRWAANARVRVYYDAVHTFCADGKGCKS